MNYMEVIKNASEEVMKVLGTNYNEVVYEEALMHEFRLRNIPYERQRNIEIFYKGYSVGTKTPDCILNPLLSGSGEEFLVEIKVGSKIDKNHVMQAQVYLLSMNISKGVVLYFNKKTNNIDFFEVNKPERTFRKDISIPSEEKCIEDIQSVLKKAGSEVLSYLGTEFFYYGEDIYINAVGVELRLRGVHFHSITYSYPILYKGHEVFRDEYKYHYIFPNGDAATIYVYKNNSEIDEQVNKLEKYNKLFGIKKGFMLALPQNEEMDIIVEEVNK